jgi:PAS domain S-box-containing protein
MKKIHITIHTIIWLILAAVLLPVLFSGCEKEEVMAIEAFQRQDAFLIIVIFIFLFLSILLLILFQRNRLVGKRLEKLVQKRTNELAFETATLTAAFNAIPDLIFCKDLSFRFTRCNKSFLDNFNVHNEDVIGKGDADGLGIPADLVKQYIENDAKVINENRMVVTEEKVPSADGEIYLFETIKVPLVQDGKVTGLLAVSRNITQRKAMEEQALSASRAKSAFLANMSHEIRTPMNAIIGMTTIGKTSADIERKDYCFSKIQDASTHLLGVINDILDMSKIEAGKFELSPVEFNFEKTLQRAVNVMGFRVDEKQQKFTVHIDKAIPKDLIADDQRLAQVITNLLGNAIKFTPEKGSIHLDTRFLGEDDLCTIQISVSDTGIGISHEQQVRLFSSFEQAENSTTRRFGGTGLGLAISKSIVEMMGGKIRVKSEPGKGSTFIFTIKAGKGTGKKQGLLAHGINWDNLRILTVDDDPDILKYFKEIMQEYEVYCDTAISGEEAIKFVETKGHYNIYFVDWKMPGMDGIQLADKLKEKTSTAGNSVVIMITAAQWTAVEEEAKKAGVDKFLSKPLFPSMIVDVINECLGVEQILNEEKQVTDVFAGQRILLVEDVEINREIVLALLEPVQLKIECAENGLEAVRMFSESPQKYDMIFMDVQMPEMDGYEATRCIRSMDTLCAKTIPIIAMTANVFREDIERCLAAGMNSHVGKPLDFDEVIGVLRLYLNKRK